MSDEIRFRATVEAARGGGHVVEVDPGLAGSIGAKHRTRVRGDLAGASYRSNLASMGGRLVLGVHKATLETAGVGTGEEVQVTMSVDAQPLPHDEVPEILAKALGRNVAAQKAWESLPPSHRRQYVGHILEAKKEETRKRRVEDAIEKMIEWAASRSR
jgi:Bacteriocin-protection, YdeI or OmpD-Associated/Domain of unknown function (DUF1905)